MTLETVNSREARKSWRGLLDKVLTGDADILIERHGKPVAVMIPVEDYEELLDELVDLRAARRAAKEYEEWKKDPSTGRPYDQVRAELVRDDLLDE